MLFSILVRCLSMLLVVIHVYALNLTKQLISTNLSTWLTWLFLGRLKALYHFLLLFTLLLAIYFYFYLLIALYFYPLKRYLSIIWNRHQFLIDKSSIRWNLQAVQNMMTWVFYDLTSLSVFLLQIYFIYSLFIIDLQLIK